MTGNHREKILIQKSLEIILHVFHMVKPKTTHQIQWVPDFFHLSPARSQDCCPWSEIGPPYSPPHFIHCQFRHAFFGSLRTRIWHMLPSHHPISARSPGRLLCGVVLRGFLCPASSQCGTEASRQLNVVKHEGWQAGEEQKNKTEIAKWTIGKASSLRPKWRMQRIEFSICFHWPGMVGGIRKTCPMMASQA